MTRRTKEEDSFRNQRMGLASRRPLGPLQSRGGEGDRCVLVHGKGGFQLGCSEHGALEHLRGGLLRAG